LEDYLKIAMAGGAILDFSVGQTNLPGLTYSGAREEECQSDMRAPEQEMSREDCRAGR